MVARDGTRAYVWLPLDPSEVVRPEATLRRRVSVATPTVVPAGPRVPAVKRLVAQAATLLSLLRSPPGGVVR